MEELLKLADSTEKLIVKTEKNLHQIIAAKPSELLEERIIPLIQKNELMKKDLRRLKGDIFRKLFQIANMLGNRDIAFDGWVFELRGTRPGLSAYSPNDKGGTMYGWFGTGDDGEDSFASKYPLDVLLKLCEKIIHPLMVYLQKEPKKRLKEVEELEELCKTISQHLKSAT